MKEILDRIESLTWKVATAGYDTIRMNIIASALSAVRSDLRALETSASDYRAAAAAYFALPSPFDGEVGTRAMTPKEIQLLEERSHAAHVLHMRIETSYFFGQRLLDNVVGAADSILSPEEGRPRGEKNLERHRKVKQRLQDRVENGLAPDPPPDLYALIDEVTEHVKDYRDDYVAHPPKLEWPPRKPVLFISADTHQVLVDESRRERTERMDELLARYVAKWLEFLESVELPYAWPPSSSSDA